MCLRRIALLLAAWPGVAPAAAEAEEVRIIGDSIGEGLHLASNVPSPANRFNVAIYTPLNFQQIQGDAARRERRHEPGHQRRGRRPRRATAAHRGRSSPPRASRASSSPGSVRPACAPPGRSIPRSSTRSSRRRWRTPRSPMFRRRTPEFCAPGLHAGDGVHFTMAGYRLLWQKAASVAGIPVLEAAASDHKVAAARGRKRILVCHKKGSSGKKLVTTSLSPRRRHPPRPRRVEPTQAKGA